MAMPADRRSTPWLLKGPLHLLLMLLLLAGCGGELSAPSPSPREIVKQQLRQVVSVDIDNEPFDKALARIGRKYGVEIRVDTKAVKTWQNQNQRGILKADGTPPKVSLRVRDIQLDSALSVLLRAANLFHEVVDGVVRVSTVDDVHKLEVGRVYPVADLVGQNRLQSVKYDTVFDEEHLASLLRAVFFSDNPRPFETPIDDRTLNGLTVMPEGIVPRPGVVVVSRPPSVHDKIEQLLADIRQLNDPATPPPTPRRTAAEAAIEAALAKPVSVDYLAKPLTDVARELAEEHGINILLDRQALYDAGSHPEATLISLDLSQQRLPLRDVLRLMLHELELTYTEGHECLWITSKDQSEAYPFVYTRLYSVEGLFDPLLGFDADDLVEVIKNNVEPAMWTEAGGPSFAEVVPGGILVAAPREAHEEVTSIKGHLANLGAAADPTVVDYDPRAWPTPRHKRMEVRLDEKTECDFTVESLDKVIAHFSKRHSLPMLFNRRALEDAGVKPEDLHITRRLRDVPLRAALQAVLMENGLAFYIDPNGRLLIITSKDDADANLITRVYRVGGLINQTNGPDVRDLIEVIQNVIKPDSWQDSGGPGPIAEFGSAVVITQTEEIHREIAQFLDGLAQVLVDPPRRFDYDASPHKAVRRWMAEKLNEPAKSKFDLDETPLPDALEEFGKQHALTIAINRRAWEDAGIVPDDTLITRSLKNLSLRNALKLILQDIGLEFILLPEQRTVLVTSKDDADAFLTTRFYGLGGVLGEQGYDSDSLVEMLKEVVEPDSWQDTGGPGSVEVFGPALIVSQTDRRHDELRKVLAGLTRFLAQQPPTADLVVGADADYRKLQAALDKPTTIKINDATLAGLRTLLSREQPDVVFSFDRRALEDAGIVPEDTVLSVDFKEVPLREILGRVCRPHKLDWVMVNNTIQFTGAEAAASIFSPPVLYPISAKLRAAGLNEEKLKALIEGHVSPDDAWSDVGGPGVIHVVPGGVIVRNGYPYARQTRGFVEKLRKLADPKPAIQRMYEQVPKRPPRGTSVIPVVGGLPNRAAAQLAARIEFGPS